MKKKSVQDSVFSNINVTPLIDVLLVLVVAFMIAIPLKLSSFDLKFPTQNPLATKAVIHETTKVQINSNGEILWNNNLIKSQEDLDTHFANVKKENPQGEISLQVNPEATYKKFSVVMSSAQRNEVSNIRILQ